MYQLKNIGVPEWSQNALWAKTYYKCYDFIAKHKKVIGKIGECN